MGFAKVLSFGCSCQPAKHIRTQLGQTEAYFFDWMISPLDATIRAIETDFEGILQPGNLAYSDHRRIRLRDAVNGLEYQHDFPVDREHPDPAKRDVILEGFDAHCDAVLDKYTRRKERTQAVIESGEPVMIVRYGQLAEELTPDARSRFVDVLRARHPKADLTFLWASMLAQDFECVPNGFICPLPHSTAWDGDPEGWRKAFAFSGVTQHQEAPLLPVG